MVYMVVIIGFISLAILFWLFWRLIYFHRNPKRIVPPGNDLVCPCDGHIIYCDDLEYGPLPIAEKGTEAPVYFQRVKDTFALTGCWSVIATYLSLFDVHLVRSPVSGKINFQHIDGIGRNRSMGWAMVAAILKHPLPVRRRSYCDKNEFVAVKIDGDVSVMLVLMADSWIRQIDMYVENDTHVYRGQVIAKIRMGSQVDVWCPTTLVKYVRVVGEKVIGGETIIGIIRYKDSIS